jgi:transposase
MKAENMSNTLKVSMIETIRELARKGWSIRRISEELGPHRNTVRKYLTADSKCTISTAGSPGDLDSKCTISTPGSAGGTGSKCTIPTAGRRSLCAAHDEFIQERLSLGLSARRIFQDLQIERSFEGSYESVKRYVRKLSECEEAPFRRMEVLPGTEVSG